MGKAQLQSAGALIELPDASDSASPSAGTGIQSVGTARPSQAVVARAAPAKLQLCAPTPEVTPLTEEVRGSRIRVLLVDDHRMMREGLKSLLSDVPDIEVIGEASDGRSALEFVAAHEPDVVVMDVGMPKLNGVEATRMILALDGRARVIALSTHTDERYVHHMLQAGACGYVLKVAAYDDLLRAVRAAKAGKTYLSPEVAGFVVERAMGPPEKGDVSVYSALSAREREVLQLVAEGKTSPEVGRQMHICTKTVETHRRNIVHKLGLHGIAELTKYAVREGLTSLEC